MDDRRKLFKGLKPIPLEGVVSKENMADFVKYTSDQLKQMRKTYREMSKIPTGRRLFRVVGICRGCKLRKVLGDYPDYTDSERYPRGEMPVCKLCCYDKDGWLPLLDFRRPK